VPDRDQRHDKYDDAQPRQETTNDAFPPAPTGLLACDPTAGRTLFRVQTSIPSRRAERWRWRLARNRRSRLTSIGSAESAAGVSINALSTW
jgi:hypothetical protein